jgi:hypothetical protein
MLNRCKRRSDLVYIRGRKALSSVAFSLERVDNWSNILYSIMFPLVAEELQWGLRVQRNV